MSGSTDKDGTAFSENTRESDGRTEIYFGQGGFDRDENGDREYGKVVQSQDDEGNTQYHYVRDASENRYIDEKR
jgi:hypothetical protein